jgi:hypothetical protein
LTQNADFAEELEKSSFLKVTGAILPSARLSESLIRQACMEREFQEAKVNTAGS